MRRNKETKRFGSFEQVKKVDHVPDWFDLQKELSIDAIMIDNMDESIPQFGICTEYNR